MRELKFRAFDKARKEMFFLPVIEGENKNWLQIDKTGINVGTKNGLLSENEFELMQFTGFYDYDKKEIFEGDIISFTDVRDCTQKKKYQIHFDNECGSWFCKNGPELCNILVEQNNDRWKRSENWTIKDNQYIRVVGNVYENPELLLFGNTEFIQTQKQL